MELHINQSIKEAFYLVYGNKNFKYTPLRFNSSEAVFIDFLKQQTDISIKDCEQDGQKYYLITDIKFTPKSRCPIDKFAMMALIYLNFENCSAFGGEREMGAGFFTVSAIERYFEYFEEEEDFRYRIFGTSDYNLGIFKCASLPTILISDDDAVAKQLFDIVKESFNTKKITCTYNYDISSIVKLDFGELAAKSVKFSFKVSDKINSRTGAISRIYYNSFKNVVEDNFKNKFINDCCSPILTHNVTVENIALFIADKIKSMGFNCTLDISVSMDNETALISQGDVHG